MAARGARWHAAAGASRLTGRHPMWAECAQMPAMRRRNADLVDNPLDGVRRAPVWFVVPGGAMNRYRAGGSSDPSER